jgi:hypothetical protein
MDAVHRQMNDVVADGEVVVWSLFQALFLLST